LRRDDTGNGACETIWVEDARVTKRANGAWRAALTLGWMAALLALLVWVVTPPRDLA
jgi:hypothetical protein